MPTIADTIFKITNTKLYVPIVTLSSIDNVNLVIIKYRHCKTDKNYLKKHLKDLLIGMSTKQK